MIILHPMNDSRHPATDDSRHHINYIFATYLKKYIDLKEDECMLSRKSEDASSMDLKALAANYSPVLVWTIDCYADISPAANGYDIQCSSYSAFVGTLNYEIYKQGRTPITSLGYTETKSRKYGSEADVTLYLGYVTNSDDLAYLQDEDNLDRLAKRIIEGEYGPPVRQIEDTDTTGNEDPYFYRFDTWKETKSNENASANITDELQSGLPINFLQIKSEDSSYTEDINGIKKYNNYTWETPLTYSRKTKCLFIGSLRSTGTNPTAYIKIGTTEFTKEISDISWTIVIFETEVSPGDTIQIGIQGAGGLDYTGIWVSPKGSLGTLDDPRSTYSIFPPGYRSVSRITSTYNSADAIHIALTTAKSLVERLKDTSEGVSTTQATASSSSSSSSGGGDLLSFAASALGYAQALSGLVAMISNFDAKSLGIQDPTKINVDYKALEESISSVSDMSKKAEMMLAVNDIKNMKISVDSATATTESIEEQAKNIAEDTQKKIEAKGADLGTSTKTTIDAEENKSKNKIATQRAGAVSSSKTSISSSASSAINSASGSASSATNSANKVVVTP